MTKLLIRHFVCTSLFLFNRKVKTLKVLILLYPLNYIRSITCTNLDTEWGLPPESEQRTISCKLLGRVVVIQASKEYRNSSGKTLI